MKEKIIIIFLLVITLISISFFEHKNNKINYTVIGNKHEFVYNLKSLNYIDLLKDNIEEKNKLNNYSKDFIYNDLRTIDLINKIKENEKINNKTIQNILNNTNLLLINLGSDELDYKLNNLIKYNSNDKEIYNYLDLEYKNIKKLIKLIKKYSNSNIIFIGFYNHSNINNKYYAYINNKLKNNKNIIFIDVSKVLNSKNSNYYLDYTENMSIYKLIIDKITCKNIY